ncbi:uncharacterized protein PGTG_21756 [Puccinia graminis f. sp. tritici CRL 75-36-700-3]|uniref:No apical meristem-associated C-terminal domain-containing protein n=1 Tax=Puccinia graminis f. sp. tritici (strain CRL 75-36-700-3 / race SCCL) TaxID=418459 RepID=H6QSD9_PUCGT|nr:uncharacterized protein PGTG_21756 [Puccinia graminis f. sp. tritici CRL 75-36-700-3]EHS63670.1 hypothetical protein PGTG_21756 [Puccinia graminis f. sp. tritici CRL 75-36-700-3]
MATPTPNQPFLDPSLVSPSDVTVVQAPDSTISTSDITVVPARQPTSDITVVPAQQPPKKPSKPRGKKAAMNNTDTAVDKTTNSATNTASKTSNSAIEPEDDTDKKGRSRTYLEHENLQLCNLWLEISEDPKKGTDQTFNPFWEAIARHYATHIPNAPRSAKSLKNHWSDKIQKEVNRFVSCVNQVQQANPSGTNSANRLTMAMSMYSRLYEKPFTMLGCYEILITSPKWNDYSRGLAKKRESTSTAANKRKEPDSSSTNLPSTNSTTTDASNGGRGGDSSSNETCGPPTRPIGRRRAKCDQAAELAAKKTQESLKKMAQDHCDIAEVAKKQSSFLDAQQAAMNCLVDESIMCKDLSGASEMMKRYYSFERSKIMARLEKEHSASNDATSTRAPLTNTSSNNATSSQAPSTNTSSAPAQTNTIVE